MAFPDNIKNSGDLLTIGEAFNAQSVEPFPIETLPSCFKSYVIEAAKAVCCAPEYIAIPLLVCAGGVIGTTRKIALKKSWTEGAGLYAAIVGDPASKKSPALEKAAGFVTELTGKLQKQYDSILNEYENQQVEYEVAYQKYKIELRKATRKGSERIEKPKEPAKPTMHRLYTVDTTVEALAELMSKNPRGIIIIRDELTGWVKSLNQYKQGKGSDRQFFLSCWNSAPIYVDRKSWNPILLEKTFLAVMGCISPDIICDLQDKQNRSDGFIDRILFAYPAPIEQRWTEDEISQEAEQQVRVCFERLLELKYIDGKKPYILRLSPEAKDKFTNWYDSHYQELNKEDFPDVLRGAWGKMPGQAARLALIIHCCRHVTECAPSIEIDRESILSAIALAQYFKKHTERAYKALDEDPTDKKIKQLLNWVKKHNKKEISARELQRNNVAGCRRASEARQLLQMLASEGFGIWSASDKKLLLMA